MLHNRYTKYVNVGGDYAKKKKKAMFSKTDSFFCRHTLSIIAHIGDEKSMFFVVKWDFMVSEDGRWS